VFSEKVAIISVKKFIRNDCGWGEIDMWEKIFLAATLTFSLNVFVHLVPAPSQQMESNSHLNTSLILTQVLHP
jgi:hypothetical protein